MKKRVLIIHRSDNGKTKQMANMIGEGVRKAGLDVDIKRVDETKVEELLKYDGVVIGSPTYFSNVSWQVKKFIDESITLFREGNQLEGKIGGTFTSSGTYKDGEDCIKILNITFGLHQKMRMEAGIIRADWSNENEILKISKEYGEKIASIVCNKDLE